MDKIYTAGRIGLIFLCAGINLPGTISGDDLDLLPLFLGEGFMEEVKDFEDVAFVNSDHAVSIHVTYDRDVVEPLSVTGLIYAGVAKTMHSYAYVGLYAVMSCLDAVSNCLPVNVFEQGNRCFVHPTDHPGDFITEVCSETAPAIRPEDIFRSYTMFMTFNPLGLVANMNRNAL